MSNPYLNALISATVGALVAVVVTSSAQAGNSKRKERVPLSTSAVTKAQPQRCDYVTLDAATTGRPGWGGNISYSKKWTKVLAAGFRLKTVDDGVYFFERCK